MRENAVVQVGDGQEFLLALFYPVQGALHPSFTLSIRKAVTTPK
jgi:hypothetical protein